MHGARLIGRSLLVVGLVGLVGSGATAQEAKRTRVDSAAVNEAIEKGKAFLYEKQQADGTWERSPQPEP